jgi:Lipid A 3-O-deacylase (PagL)
MNDVDVTTRLGWMLSDPVFEGIFRGNFEVVTELFGGGFVKGPADGLMGVTLFLRYNYVQPGARLVPYVHAGGGGVYSDASEAHPQRELGSPLFFNLQAGFGARFFCTETCALFLELNYRHLSNGGLAERNVGLNSAGSWLGVSFFF